MNKILVEISARHVHVNQETLEILFGKGHQLTPKKDLSQPGQYACEERVTVRGPRGEQKNVIILGPVRPRNQVELSATDARSLGIPAYIRESGDVTGTGACTLVGPHGEVDIDEGVIIAKRHIHMTPEDASHFGVENDQVVSVSVKTDDRSLIYGDVVIRVSPKFALAMHIDTDEANAAGLAGATYGELIK